MKKSLKTKHTSKVEVIHKKIMKIEEVLEILIPVVSAIIFAVIILNLMY